MEIGHGFDERLFERADGLEVDDETKDVLRVDFFILGLEEGEAAIQVVLHGVAGACGLAVRGARTGGEGCVLAGLRGFGVRCSCRFQSNAGWCGDLGMLLI